ncbi:hypothetical protein Aperf_G00000021431 [Anoplocephala perfoliata]
MLLSCKRLFIKCVGDCEECALEPNGEPKWRGKLKLIAVICRIMVGCLQQFQSVLFLTNENCEHRKAVDFISWMIEVQYAGGLFSSGTGLEANFLKEVSTSLFVATEMALSSITRIASKSGQEASTAAKAIVLANLTPLVNSRILSKILANLSNCKGVCDYLSLVGPPRAPLSKGFCARFLDHGAFKLWLSEEFNAYSEFFTNLDAAFADWKPYEATPDVSSFHIPRFLNLQIDQKSLSSAVEQFLTKSTIEISRSVRNLPNEFFGYLESALLQIVLHASPVISIVGQDIWCFVARYGNADLCWQYVTLLGNTVLCLAERHTSASLKSHPPLEQMSRLGGLLSRFLVFLTARQQREFLSIFPLFDGISGGATEKSLLWRFLLLGRSISQFQPSIRPLLERQVLERVSYLLRIRSALTSLKSATDWLLDALTCLRLAEDFTSSALVPHASLLAQLCVATLTFDESEIVSMAGDSEELEGTPIAPPYLFCSTDPSTRLECICGLLAQWLPPRLLLLASEQPDSDFEKIVQVLFAELRTSCRNGLHLPALNAISTWILGCTTDQQPSNATSSPLSAFVLASLPPTSAASQPSSSLSSTVSQALSSLWSPLCQTELNSECKLTREIVKKLKVKIRERCPNVDRYQKRPLELDSPESAHGNNENIVDAHLTALAEVVAKLEGSTDVLTPAQRGLGSALTRRLNTLFSPT